MPSPVCPWRSSRSLEWAFSPPRTSWPTTCCYASGARNASIKSSARLGLPRPIGMKKSHGGVPNRHLDLPLCQRDKSHRAKQTGRLQG
jgi:hypothetical protein